MLEVQIQGKTALERVLISIDRKWITGQ